MTIEDMMLRQLREQMEGQFTQHLRQLVDLMPPAEKWVTTSHSASPDLHTKFMENMVAEVHKVMGIPASVEFKQEYQCDFIEPTHRAVRVLEDEHAGSIRQRGIERIIETPALDMVQFRFPKSKKKRIRKKWAKRPENWRPNNKAYLAFDGTLYVSPHMKRSLKTPDFTGQ